MEEARALLARSFEILEEECGIAENQCFRLGMLANMLKVFGDPDWDFFKKLQEGVPLGVSEEMDRVPEVFEEKTKWNLEDDALVPEYAMDNYQSVEGTLWMR